MIRYTGRAGQFRDAHGTVRYSLRLPKSGQRRRTAGLMRDAFPELDEAFRDGMRTLAREKV